MPIVDGLTSTKMIRSIEKSHTDRQLSARAALNGRVPVFAVSASLLERERQTYIDAGFDGWILKPIDFKRLNVLLEGIVDEAKRENCLYKPGEWEKGGWFKKRQPSVFVADTKPSGHAPVQKSSRKDSLTSSGTSVTSGSSSVSGYSGSDSGTTTPTPSRIQARRLESEQAIQQSRSPLENELSTQSDATTPAVDTPAPSEGDSENTTPSTAGQAGNIFWGGK